MIYINFDLETTGWVPRRHAVLSIGAVAHRQELVGSTLEPVSDFTMNLEVPPWRSWDADTRAWWALPENEKALAASTSSPWEPETAIPYFMNWLLGLKKEGEGIAFVANPAAFDFPLLRDYMESYEPRWAAFAAENHCGIGCLDLPTLAMVALGKTYPESRRRHWKPEWISGDQPHVALEDARRQSYAFVEIMMELKQA